MKNLKNENAYIQKLDAVLNEFEQDFDEWKASDRNDPNEFDGEFGAHSGAEVGWKHTDGNIDKPKTEYSLSIGFYEHVNAPNEEIIKWAFENQATIYDLLKAKAFSDEPRYKELLTGMHFTMHTEYDAHLEFTVQVRPIKSYYEPKRL
jgi:hypothetical protein